MFAAIRIRGKVLVKPDTKSTLKRLNLDRKHTCVLVPETPVYKGMLQQARDWIAYGTIKPETATKLLLKRGKSEGKLITEEWLKQKKLSASDLVTDVEKMKKAGIKPVFKLGPARGGLKSSKAHYPKGALGNWGSIDALVEKMM